MFELTLGKTTGKQVVKLIEKAMQERRKKTGKNITKVDFCVAADMSRNMLHRYSRGEKPGADGIAKIASGLDKWGIAVVVKMYDATLMR